MRGSLGCHVELGWPSDNAKQRVLSKDVGPDGLRAFRSSRVRFDFRSGPTFDRIKLELDAYVELHGGPPSIVVIDNVTNIRSGGIENDEDPFAGLEVIMEFLQEIAHTTGAAVIGLHHVLGRYNDGDIPIPLGGIKGQISRVPETILTLHRGQDHLGNSQIRVSTVKQRGGRMDPSGLSWVPLEFDGATMTIRDPQ